MTYKTNPTDETLVLLTLSGDEGAYEILVARHQKAVIASALSVTGSRFMAEDAAQDAFVTAWMKLDTLNQPERFGTWAARIAKNAAVNMVTRYRTFVDLDTVENTDLADDPLLDPSEMYIDSEHRTETNREVRRSIDKLPRKVGQIIRFHYIEGLTVAEIAERMGITQGTVKSQLHDGRRKLRKELCAMNEKYNDTLVQKVMKKVEELKLWQFKNCKDGFEEVYRDVLREVEDLPESDRKYHALADVLMRGWWWIPGEKNDALFERIREAATVGRNEEVMEFIVTREDGKIWGDAKIEFMRDTQIPKLREGGFTKTLGREWFWLGYWYYDSDRAEEGDSAFDEAAKILGVDNPHHALIPEARRMFKLRAEKFSDTHNNRYRMGCCAYELSITGGIPRYRNDVSLSKGYLNSCDTEIIDLLRQAARGDGWYYDKSLSVGESFTASDGATLTFISDCETVVTPSVTYDGCALFVTRVTDKYEGPVCVKVWYKDGVGIVRFQRTVDGFTDCRVLSSSRIVGGGGLLPLAVGNTWEYAHEYNPEVMDSRLSLTVAYADDDKAVITSEHLIERLKYDEDSWHDMTAEVRCEYCPDDCIKDVSNAAKRAVMLAKTPMEKAHAKAAASAVRRIMETDPRFNPEHTATGHWNFFERGNVIRKNGTADLIRHHRWSFEWKSAGGMGEALTPILFNDIYGILSSAAKCIWSDEWTVGASPVVEYTGYGERTIRTQITCEDGGTVTAKAGVFENCLRVNLDITGMADGWSYRGGNKVYYFAPGIGIVRIENEYCSGARTAVYELTSYEGVGEGYMPLSGGLVRRYDALDLTDGFEAWVEYTYVEEDGQLVIFKDAAGIRHLSAPVTQYSAILYEQREETLWDERRRDEARLLHDVNNLRLLLHFLGRQNYNWAAPEKAAEWFKYHIRIVEFLGEGGGIPRAWLGRYWRAHFGAACATFGIGTEEAKAEGYRLLELAFEHYPRWKEIPDGEALEIGNPFIFGGVKLIKGKGLILLPDGTKEPIDNDYLFHPTAEDMYRGMTAPHGWEWFNPVRGEEKFKEYVARAKKLTEE
ncbi:MAG: RNA polymerase sigma factor [Ruminococcaceae bacterium]|nr:RNA polymerase sigma factor [Oscillospiraceae bacterium]